MSMPSIQSGWGGLKGLFDEEGDGRDIERRGRRGRWDEEEKINRRKLIRDIEEGKYNWYIGGWVDG